MIFAIAGLALQMYGQYQQGQDEEAMAKYNAGLMDMQASNIEANRIYATQRQAEQIKRYQADTIAKSSKQGVGWQSTSRMMMLNESYYNMQVDSAILDYNAKIEAQTLRSQADMMRKTGKNMAQAGQYKAGSTLLSNVGGYYAQSSGTQAGVKSQTKAGV